MDKLRDEFKQRLSGIPSLYRTLSLAYRSLNVARGMAFLATHADDIRMGAHPILIQYGGQMRPRWGHGSPAHPALLKIIDANRAQYRDRLLELGAYRRQLEAIPAVSSGTDSVEFAWRNNFFTGLDAASLYYFIARSKPQRYIEIGSGNSTKMARRAVRDCGLSTSVTSIDPFPRASIDSICDRVIRRPLEEVDLKLFDELEDGDILFFDGSHYAFMNSDVVVLWLEIIPRLRPGVLVHLHDIFLPYDYPPDFDERHYSEQYLLAVSLLANQSSWDIVFPNQFVVTDPELRSVAQTQLGPLAIGSESSFWLKRVPPNNQPPK